jgi:hypothetical protein
MTFFEATKIAPDDADFIQYVDTDGTSVTVQRHSDGALNVIAESNLTGAVLIAAGIAAWGRSLFDADAGRFVCGTLAQLDREI